MEEGKGVRMRVDDSLRPNTNSGRRNHLAPHVTMVPYIHIQEQDLNLPPFKERVHLWTTIRVSSHL